MSTQAQRLRGRLSIDPDAAPVPAPAPSAPPAAATGTPEVEQGHAPDPSEPAQPVPQQRPAWPRRGGVFSNEVGPD